MKYRIWMRTTEEYVLEVDGASSEEEAKKIATGEIDDARHAAAWEKVQQLVPDQDVEFLSVEKQP